MYYIYNILSIIALLLYLPFLFTKKGPENKKSFIKERLGISKYTKADIWFHVVSVGEVLAAIPLIKSIKREFPEMRLIISTITYTGQRLAREKFPEANRILYMPWDAGFIISNVVKSTIPNLFITIDTELWPNLFKYLKKYNSRILLMNGRISPSSYKGYHRIRPFIRKVLSHLDMICMQDETGAKRVLSLGAEPEKVKIIGNFKFDIGIPEKSRSWAELLRCPVMTAGSTHRGEEVIILKAFKEIKKYINDMKLVIAPRHPERFNEVEEIIKKNDFQSLRRSNIDINDTKPIPDKIDVILLDTIGELSTVYAYSTFVFVGGSLVSVGGHNILEPAYWSKPILVGPIMHNFPIVSEFFEKGAAIEVKDHVEISEKIISLNNNMNKAEEMGKRAREIVEKNVGAVERAMKIIKELS